MSVEFSMPFSVDLGQPIHHVWLDTDVGTDVDDAIALLLLAASPGVELVGVSTVSGHTGVRAALAKRLLDQAGHFAVDVVAGEEKPLPSSRFGLLFPDGLWFGHEAKGVLSDEEIACASDQTPDVAAALDHMTALVEAVNEPITILTIGPCTNLAKALSRNPSLRDRVGQHVAMGGVVNGPIALAGHKLSPGYEYNFNADREAFAQVLEAGLNTTLVPAEQTYRTRWDVEKLDVLRHTGQPSLISLCALMEIWSPVCQRGLAAVGIDERDIVGLLCLLHDPMAVLVALRPELFGIEEVRIDLVEEDGFLVTRPSTSGAFEVRVVNRADGSQVNDLVLEQLLSWGVGRSS
jgi:purine nucleosidase